MRRPGLEEKRLDLERDRAEKEMNRFQFMNAAKTRWLDLDGTRFDLEVPEFKKAIQECKEKLDVMLARQ